MKEIQKGYDLLVCGGNAAAGCSSIGTDTNGGEEQIFILRTHNVFAQCFLRQNEVYGQINTLASAKSCQPVLSQSDVLSLEIEQPFDNAIAEFERIVPPLFKGIVNIFKQTAFFAASRDMLLHRLMKEQSCFSFS